ncbi:MAG: DNA polymerase I, partial [Succinivibrionaceae bacterium]|nr:DNA polymerase I [Succinivibrionaceae bacterium]
PQGAAPAAPSPAPEAGGPEPEDFRSRGLRLSAITTREGLEELAGRIRAAGLMAIDTETTSLRPADCTMVGISVSIAEGEGFYLPIAHSDLTSAQLSLGDVTAALGPLLRDPAILKVGHNLKFDLLVLHYAGLEVEGVHADTMVMAHLLDSAARVGMDELALSLLSYRDIRYQEVVTRGMSSFAEASVAAATPYAAEDAEVTLRLYHCLLPRLEADATALKWFREVEMPLLMVLYRMEREGARVDAQELARQGQALKAELATVSRDVFAAAGEEFNINSPKQLGHIIFEKIGAKPPRGARKERGGVVTYSTAEDVLTELAPTLDLANLVLRHRTLSKLISTYTDKLQQEISPRTGRVHTSFNQAGTVTGRLSSSDPNLQNIPARTEEGKRIRLAFTAPAGYTILSADYSQIELRLIAHLSGDESLTAAFIAGRDIHRSTAAEVLGKPFAEVSDEERAHAKATNFGLMYGMGSYGLSRQTGMPVAAAKAYIDRYFERYPKVRAYMEGLKERARRDGFVSTITGRRIMIPELQSSSDRQARAGERQAINAPMQGSAADIIKIAMVAIDRYLSTLPPGSVRMVLQVHDELVFEVRDELLSEVQGKIVPLMEHAVELSVPLTVGVGCARSWGEAH